MTVIETIKELRQWVDARKETGMTIGFVPTMGALHAGHLSLLERARSENNCVVVSIFVNPTQFNNPEDLAKYPRTWTRDAELLEAAGCDVVFHPSVKEMYPKEEKRTWDFGLLSTTLEGHYRPGHFDGVLTIVLKLFQAVSPDRAYFGEKDFQQLSLIRRMTETEKLAIEVVPCPSVRESSGLAMSSRNTRLDARQTEQALAISRVLFKMREMKETMSPVHLTLWARNALSTSPGIRLEYLEIVESDTFEVITDWTHTKKPVALVAAYVGEVRLIDNIFLG